MGGSVQALQLNAELVASGTQVDVTIPAVLAVGSVEYSAHDLLLAAEYSRWYITENSSDAALYPESSTASVFVTSGSLPAGKSAVVTPIRLAPVMRPAPSWRKKDWLK